MFVHPISSTRLIKYLLMSTCRPTGATFEIPHKNVQTTPLPVQGDIVTFKYETNSHKAKLNKAIVSRLREDLTWRDVVLSFAQQTASSKGVNICTSVVGVVLFVEYVECHC